MHKLIALLVMVLSATVAHAEPADKGKGGPIGRGSGGVSPVMMTCGPDLDQFCDGKRGMPGVQCLMENITDISEPCADALDQASANMDRNHGGGRDDSDQD